MFPHLDIATVATLDLALYHAIRRLHHIRRDRRLLIAKIDGQQWQSLDAEANVLAEVGRVHEDDAATGCHQSARVHYWAHGEKDHVGVV